MNSQKRFNGDFILGASCHNQEEIEKANELQCDYVLISPVQENKNKIKKLDGKTLKNLQKVLMEKALL